MTSIDTEISCHTHRHIRSHVNGTSSLLLGVFWYTQFYTHKYIAGWLRLLHDNKAKDKRPILKFSNSSWTQVPWNSLSFLPSEIISGHDLLLVSEDHNSSIKKSHSSLTLFQYHLCPALVGIKLMYCESICSYSWCFIYATNIHEFKLLLQGLEFGSQYPYQVVDNRL